MFSKLILSSLLVAGSTSLFATLPMAPPSYEEPQEIVIYNRILARVGNKTISVLDLVKKMDVFLTSHYPQMMESKMARFQFYTSNWREVLQQMVDAELTLTDAGEKDFGIKEGEIRESLLEKFGPNVMVTLDKCGLSYEEARKMVQDELVVGRMNWFKVQAKALQEVGPQDIRNAYKDYLVEHPSEDEWTYQVMSIRSPHREISEKLAQEAFSLIHEAKADFASIRDKLEERKKENAELAVSISEELTATDRTISSAHRKGLEGLKAGECSSPITQISGNGQIPVQRIFLLKQRTVKSAPAFQDIKDQLKQKQIETVMQREDRIYKERLRHRYNHLLAFEELPSHFEPFSIEVDHS